jgi:lipopolysaccharide/colanic/teichoic acid biosynthesis glycosyltransferase
MLSGRKTRSSRSHVAKRVFDLVVGVFLIALLFPVMGLVALTVLVDLGRPVLLGQQRPGLYGKPFILFKFRTMRDERDAGGRLLPDARRVTALGRFLRRMSLDELPGLFNVIRGEMSLVGPRPLLMEYLDRYSARQMRRHEVKPGITGWTQLNGRNSLTWEQKFDYDLWYVEHGSLSLDALILVRTVWKVLTGEGVTPPGREDVTEFRGSPRGRDRKAQQGERRTDG